MPFLGSIINSSTSYRLYSCAVRPQVSIYFAHINVEYSSLNTRCCSRTRKLVSLLDIYFEVRVICANRSEARKRNLSRRNDKWSEADERLAEIKCVGSLLVMSSSSRNTTYLYTVDEPRLRSDTKRCYTKKGFVRLFYMHTAFNHNGEVHKNQTQAKPERQSTRNA